MAKGQLRSNREHKKPKQPKQVPALPKPGLGTSAADSSSPGKSKKK